MIVHGCFLAALCHAPSMTYLSILGALGLIFPTSLLPAFQAKNFLSLSPRACDLPVVLSPHAWSAQEKGNVQQPALQHTLHRPDKAGSFPPTQPDQKAVRKQSGSHIPAWYCRRGSVTGRGAVLFLAHSN